jgi:hypothetical protein
MLITTDTFRLILNCSSGLGTIGEIRQRVDEIFRILEYGCILITDSISVSDQLWGRGNQIVNNTFQGAMQGLPDLIEHCSAKEELTGLFSGFQHVTVENTDHFYFDKSGHKLTIKALDVEATK